MIKVEIKGTVKTLNEGAMLLTRIADGMHHIEDTAPKGALLKDEFTIGLLHVTLEQDDETN